MVYNVSELHTVSIVRVRVGQFGKGETYRGKVGRNVSCRTAVVANHSHIWGRGEMGPLDGVVGFRKGKP
jgi:hypothetical protein